MRFLIGSLVILLGPGCRNVELPRKPYHHPVPRTVIVSAATTSPATARIAANTIARAPAPPLLPAAAPAVTTTVIHDIRFEGVSFDSRHHRLIVSDQAAGPGSQYADAAVAARAAGGVAAINAGYFTPEGKPLGLVVADGTVSGGWNSASSLGSGVWHSPSSGPPAIKRRENLGPASARKSRQLIQAGPMLVDNSRSVGGLEATKPAIRTLIAWDGGTRWWIGRSSACTLADLGKALASGGPAGWPVSHALNLDGGRSSDLWASPTVSGGPLTRRASWNRPVRNFLVLVPS